MPRNEGDGVVVRGGEEGGGRGGGGGEGEEEEGEEGGGEEVHRWSGGWAWLRVVQVVVCCVDLGRRQDGREEEVLVVVQWY